MSTQIRDPKKCLCINFNSNADQGKYQCSNCSNFNKDTGHCSLDNAPFILMKKNFVRDPHLYTCDNFEKADKPISDSESPSACINCKHYSAGSEQKILPYCFNPKAKPRKIEWQKIEDPDSMLCSGFKPKTEDHNNNCCSSCSHFQKSGCDMKGSANPEYLLACAENVKITYPPDKTFCKSFVPKNKICLKSRCSECSYFNEKQGVCSDNRTALGVARNKFPSFMKVSDVCPVSEAKNYTCDNFSFNSKCKTYCKEKCCFNCNNYIKDKNAVRFSACTGAGNKSPNYRRTELNKSLKFKKRVSYKIIKIHPPLSPKKLKKLEYPSYISGRGSNKISSST